jgi:adenylate cyclase class 2
MGYEIEVKYRLVDADQLRRRLAQECTDRGPEITQEDTYFSHPSRDFAISNEALRLRRIAQENRITYKGPRHSGPTKTREEIEIPFAVGDEAARDLLQMFERLGFNPVATIRKTRTPFHLTVDSRQIEIAIDDAEGLGRFAEIETLAATNADLPAAQAAVLAVARRFALAEVEPRSYLRMALESQRASDLGAASSAQSSNPAGNRSPWSDPQAG